MKLKKIHLRIVIPLLLILVLLVFSYYRKYSIHKNIDLLKSSDSVTRNTASQYLVEAGKPAVAPLIFAIRFDAAGAQSSAMGFLARLTGHGNIRDSAKSMEGESITQKEEIALILGEIGDARAVEPLVNLIRINNPGINKNVGNSLKKFGRLPVKPLVSLLDNHNQKARCTAARILGEIGGEEAVPPLISLLETGDIETKDAAADGLVLAGKPSVQPLVKLLKHKDPKNRHRAANALGRIGEGEAVKYLAASLHDPDENVKYEALNALGKIGGRDAVMALLDFLKNYDYKTTFMIDETARALKNACKGDKYLTALSYIGSEYYKQKDFVLKELLEESPPEAYDSFILALKDDEHNIRRMAATGLGKIRDRRAVEPLLEAFRESDFIDNHEISTALFVLAGDEFVKKAIQENLIYQIPPDILLKSKNPAIIPSLIKGLYNDCPQIIVSNVEALGIIGDARAVEPLIALLNEKDEIVRNSAIEALGRISDKRASRHILKFLGDRDEDTRVVTAEALAKIGDKSINKYLIAMLKSGDKNARAGASKALGKMGVTEAVIPLTKLLEDSSSMVREEAVLALGALKDPRSIDALVKALEQKDIDYYHIIETIVEIKGDRAVDALSRLLVGEDPEKRSRAVYALGKINSNRAVEVLMASLALGEDSHYNRDLTIKTLAKTEKARKYLKAALKSKNPKIRDGAKEALKLMDGGPVIVPREGYRL